MVAGNLDCISSFCRLHFQMKTPRKKMKDDVHQKGEALVITVTENCSIKN
jgi:hypothetical protein